MSSSSLSSFDFSPIQLLRTRIIIPNPSVQEMHSRNTRTLRRKDKHLSRLLDVLLENSLVLLLPACVLVSCTGYINLFSTYSAGVWKACNIVSTCKYQYWNGKKAYAMTKFTGSVDPART